MKNIYKVFFLLLLLSSLSKNSFAQYPFYGFELSNYEVGDTLEYSSTTLSFPGVITCNYAKLYAIIGKEFLAGNDSVKYTIKYIGIGNCNNNSFNINDTFESVINNDTIYNNTNNLTHYLLTKIDTIGQRNLQFDSLYTVFDTVNGLMRLKVKQESILSTFGFEVIQNLGVVYSESNSSNQHFNWNDALVYAHLAHYGIYGEHEYISDGVNKIVLPQANISIRYDNGGNALLLYSSNENIIQPTLAVYDLLGRKVGTQPVNIGSNIINTNNLAAGMYLYKVMSNEKVIGQGKFMNLK